MLTVIIPKMAFSLINVSTNAALLEENVSVCRCLPLHFTSSRGSSKRKKGGSKYVALIQVSLKT